MSLKWDFYPVAEFPALKDAWQSVNLLDASSPVLSPEFVAPLLQEFAAGSERLAVCRKDSQTVAMAVLVRRSFAVWETFQPAQAPIGLWLNSPEVNLEELLQTLLDSLPGYPMLFALTQRDPELWPRPSDRGRIRTMDYVETGIISLEDSYQGYWGSRDAQLRKSVNRRLRQLAEQGIEPRLEAMSNPASVSDAVEQFGRLESMGWKGKEGTAVHGSNSQGRFYSSVLEDFCRKGKGFIYRYWFGGAVVAMQLSIEVGGVEVFLKTTFDENYRAFGPGILLKRAIIEFLYGEKRVQRIELYGKLRDYQTKWISSSKMMYHVNYCRWAGLHRLLELMRAGLRSLPSRNTEAQD